MRVEAWSRPIGSEPGRAGHLGTTQPPSLNPPLSARVAGDASPFLFAPPLASLASWITDSYTLVPKLGFFFPRMSPYFHSRRDLNTQHDSVRALK